MGIAEPVGGFSAWKNGPVSGYTVINLRDVEDSATKFGLAPDLEARFARSDLGAEQTAISLQRLAPGARMPFGHRHASQEELYVVVDGEGSLKLDDEVVPVRRWDAVRVSPGTMRAFEAGPPGIEFLAFGAPMGAKNDAEMVQGWWADGGDA